MGTPTGANCVEHWAKCYISLPFASLALRWRFACVSVLQRSLSVLKRAQEPIVWSIGPNVASAFPSLRWRFCSNKRTDNDTLLPRAPLASSRAIIMERADVFPRHIFYLEGARVKQKNGNSRKLNKKRNERNFKKFKEK